MQKRGSTSKNGITIYEYDAVGNLLKETNRNGSVSYAYNAQNKLTRGTLSDGQSSEYTYNALGARVKNVQIRKNKNARYSNADLKRGSGGEDYLDFLKDGRLDWQRVFESEVGTVHQNVLETVAKTYITDYLSIANRDIMVAEDGSFVQRYVYDENSRRISAEFDYADGTHRGEAGENMASDFAVELGKVWYRTNLLDSTLFAVDADGEVVTHTIYDPWGNPQTEIYADTNLSGIDNLNNFTGYTWDETLGLYFAQNRFYDAENHRFTQEDIVKDGTNWYVYVANSPMIYVDVWGRWTIAVGGEAAAAFVLRLGVSGQLAIDDNGNLGLLLSISGGGGTPNVSGGVSLTGTNADTIFDLGGLGFLAGGSVGPVGVTVIAAPNGIYGGAVSISGSAIPFDVHGELGATGVISLNWMFSKKKRMEIYEFVKKYYEKLSCEQQEYFESMGIKF